MPTKRRTAKPGKGPPDTPDTGRTPSASGDAPVQKQPVFTPSQRGAPSRMKTLLGFEWSDVSSWSALVKLLHSPRDPASIAVWRILFGILMMIDIPQERGMAYADYRWGDINECRFPLFNGLTPLPVDWMYLAYFIMYTGAVGIFLGAFYRLSCLLFLIPYWYIFFLDKTTWNNHSYLYGLISVQLLFMDGNRFWSLDGWWNPKIRNANIPLWNIAIIRFQIFIVYFYAGLKKLDADWIGGYSMEYLSEHWIFEPFRLLLTDEQIDYLIVHLGGLFLDLSAGFLLFFDATRSIGTFFCSSFHIMNSQIFSIGMFPYAMLASTTVFYSASWPRKFCSILPSCLKNRIPSVSFSNTPQPSANCIYVLNKENAKKSDSSKKAKNTTGGWRHHTAVVGLILYVCIQLFLPYSHFITKGYNNWTNGLYGYSWDMMVHTWHTQHVKVKYIDGKTGEEGYLAPDYWTESNRWASHSDMTKQYATCIGHHLKKIGSSEPQLYMDVWKSMNGRFQQRMFNPTVDLIKAGWSPFSATPWLMPLLTELSDWRTTLSEIEDQLDEELDITFVADFPGMYLENYISEDLGNTTIQVLSGKVMVELVERKRNVTLEIGDRIQLPAGAFHNVHTVSDTPSCYMYVFVNTTEHAIIEEAKRFLNTYQEHSKDSDDDAPMPTSIDPRIFEGLNMSDAVKIRILERLSARIERNEQASRSVAEKAQLFLEKKKVIFFRTIVKTAQALNHIFFGGESVVLSVGDDEHKYVPGDSAPDDKPTHQDHGEL